MVEFLKDKKNLICVGVVFIISVIVFAIFIIKNNLQNNYNFELNDSVENISEINNTIGENNVDNRQMYVHIVGEVINSGVYELVDGERIIDIIKKAGGVTEQADLSKVNLAYKLLDGQKIIIPNVSESSDNDFVYVINNAGNNVISNDGVNAKININIASQTELETINGIGASTAKKIIEYRDKNGYFKSVDDLMNISGIGKSKVDNIREYVVVK